MSRRYPTEPEVRMLRYDCERCGETAGVWCCSNRTDRWTTYLHASRFWQATADGLLPLTDPQ